MNRSVYKATVIFSVFLLLGAGCLGGGDQQPQEQETFSGTLKEALGLEQSMRCVWSSEEGEGTTYIKGERMRTETAVNGDSGVVISDGSCTYIWEEGSVEGIEICLPEGFSESVGDDALFETTEAEGPAPDVQVDCQVTNVSDDMFDPPANITFSNPFEDLFNF